MPWQMLAPPNGSLVGPAFLTKHPPFSHQAWEICLAGIQRKWKTTEQPETLDWTKPGVHCLQQGGVLENSTFVKPEREDNTEPGMGNEICMYLGPHPDLSSHCTSCLCIQGALDPIQRRCRETNVALTTPLMAGRNKEDPPRLNLFPFLILIYTHHPHAWKEASQLYRFALLWEFEVIKLLACLFRSN